MKKIITYFILFIFTTACYLQETPDKVVNIKVISPKIIQRGSTGSIQLIINIKKGWHINSNSPLDKNLVPTTIKIKEDSSYKAGAIVYPAAMIKNLEFSEDPLSLFEDETVIKIPVSVPGNFKGKNITITGTLQYQPCNDQTCLFPATKNFAAEIKTK